MSHDGIFFRIFRIFWDFWNFQDFFLDFLEFLDFFHHKTVSFQLVLESFRGFFWIFGIFWDFWDFLGFLGFLRFFGTFRDLKQSQLPPRHPLLSGLDNRISLKITKCPDFLGFLDPLTGEAGRPLSVFMDGPQRTSSLGQSLLVVIKKGILRLHIFGKEYTIFYNNNYIRTSRLKSRKNKN